MKKERQRRIVALLTAECGKKAKAEKEKNGALFFPFFTLSFPFVLPLLFP